MRHSLVPKLAAVVLLCNPALGQASGAAHTISTGDTSVVFVHLDQSRHRFFCSINGRDCAPHGKFNSLALLNTLGDVYRSGEKSKPVVVAFTGRVPFEYAGSAKEIAQKVGFEKVRYFLENTDTGILSEIDFCSSFHLLKDKAGYRISIRY